MRFAWVRDALVPEFTVRDCCRTLRVSPSGYYRFVRSPVPRRQARRSALLPVIMDIFVRSGCTYGSPRVHRDLLAGACAST